MKILLILLILIWLIKNKNTVNNKQIYRKIQMHIFCTKPRLDILIQQENTICNVKIMI